jgi:hypothetical protein
MKLSALARAANHFIFRGERIPVADDDLAAASGEVGHGQIRTPALQRIAWTWASILARSFLLCERICL